MIWNKAIKVEFSFLSHLHTVNSFVNGQSIAINNSPQLLNHYSWELIQLHVLHVRAPVIFYRRPIILRS